jgi:hypothetical protein
MDSASGSREIVIYRNIMTILEFQTRLEIIHRGLLKYYQWFFQNINSIRIDTLMLGLNY